MNNYEFYSYDDEVYCRKDDCTIEKVTEHSTEIIDNVYNMLCSHFPDTYKALSEIYKRSELNVPYYKYVVVKRFIKCNFSKIDTTYTDIETIGDIENINFEKVDCPLRGECPHEGVICQPKFSTKLTDRELSVAKYWYIGKSKEDISRTMFLSAETVNNHIRRIYKKLNVHSLAEFVKYVNAKNMFCQRLSYRT